MKILKKLIEFNKNCWLTGWPIYGHQDKWSIPKGELDTGEDHLTAAYREFFEEVGIQPPTGDLIELGNNKQTNGKLNFIWAVESDLDITPVGE